MLKNDWERFAVLQHYIMLCHARMVFTTFTTLCGDHTSALLHDVQNQIQWNLGSSSKQPVQVQSNIMYNMCNMHKCNQTQVQTAEEGNWEQLDGEASGRRRRVSCLKNGLEIMCCLMFLMLVWWSAFLVIMTFECQGGPGHPWRVLAPAAHWVGGSRRRCSAYNHGAWDATVSWSHWSSYSLSSLILITSSNILKQYESVTCAFVIHNHWIGQLVHPDIDQCHDYHQSKRAMSLSPSLLAIQDDDFDEDERASLASSLQSQFGTPLFGLSPSEEVFLHTAWCSIHGQPAVIWQVLSSPSRGGFLLPAAAGDRGHGGQHHGVRNRPRGLSRHGDGGRSRDVRLVARVKPFSA